MGDTWQSLAASPISDMIRRPRLVLCTSCPGPRVSHFSRGLWFLYWEMKPRDHDPGTRVFIATGLVIVPRYFQKIALGCCCYFSP